jgi:hypothetical protein
MHEILKRRSRCGTTVSGAKSDLLKANKAKMFFSKANQDEWDPSKGANRGSRVGPGGSGVSIQGNQDDPITSDHLRPNQTKSDQKKRSSPEQGAGRWIKTGADEPRFGWIGLDAREFWPDERERQRLE